MSAVESKNRSDQSGEKRVLPTDRIAHSAIADRAPLKLPDGARVMALVVHPYIMCAPHRLKYFRKIFENIRRKPDVKFCTGEQILDWYLSVGPKSPRGPR